MEKIKTFDLLRETKEVTKDKSELFIKVNNTTENTIAMLNRMDALLYIVNLLQKYQVSSISIDLKKSDKTL